MGVEFTGANHRAPHPRVEGAPAPVDLADDDERQLAVGTGSAAKLLAVLGLPYASTGELPIPEARDRLTRGRAATPAADLTRTTVGPNGALPSLGAQLGRLETMLNALADLGATHVRWS